MAESLTPDEFARWFGNATEQAARRAVLSSAERIIQLILTELIPEESPQPVDIGTFRAGWRADPTGDGAMIVNTVPHAAHIEYGVKNVRPGASMHKALTEWVVRKGISNVDDAPEVAAAIMWALKKRGIFKEGKGFRFLERALKRLPKIWEEELSREMKRLSG